MEWAFEDESTAFSAFQAGALSVFINGQESGDSSLQLKAQSYCSGGTHTGNLLFPTQKFD
jgi:hypothetical protein